MISAFCCKYAIVTSPIRPKGVGVGIGMRYIAGDLRLRYESSHLGSVTTLSASKCFHPRMVLAADGSARIIVFPPLAGN